MPRRQSESQLESAFQADLIDELYARFPGCFIVKNDPALRQGIPDLTVLYRDKWAMLEVKASSTSSERPNQRYYVEQFADMHFGAFIFPENKEEILRELQQAFRA